MNLTLSKLRDVKRLSLPKPPAGHLSPVRPTDTRRGRRVNRLSLISRGLTGIKNETWPDGSLPRKARPMDEKTCCWLENRHPAESSRGTEATISCRAAAKQRAVRIDDVNRPPGE